MKRAEAAQIFFQREFIQVNVIQENSLRKEGKTVRKLSQRIAAVTWFLQLVSWENSLISSGLMLSLKTGI